MNKSINIYTKYNVDINKLTRDYLKFPLKKFTKRKYEKLPKEDLLYLFIECNLPRKILAQYLNVSETHIKRLNNQYNIKKTPKQIFENCKKYYRENYGVINYFQTKEFREKSKQTCIEKYGVEHISQTNECKEKKKQTCLKHYGVEHPAQSPIIQEKVKQTNLQNLGVEYPGQSPIVLEKMKQTCIERYGTEYYTQTNESKNRYKNEEYVNQVNEKIYKTRKKNNSFGKSKEEDKIYDILLTKFNEVIRQYHSDLYPFNCDFYIPEKDLYIEYQGYWQHGFEPYLGTVKQNKIVESWKGKGTDQYSSAIKTWTVRDPQKRDTAKQNNLNWIEFFNMDEFIKWFESI